MTEIIEDSQDTVILPKGITFNYNDKANCFELKLACSIFVPSITLEQIEALKEWVENLILIHEKDVMELLNEKTL